MDNKAVFTIGVYGTTEHSFFDALKSNGITHFVDIRRRRGMRGSQYSYANSSRLQQILNGLGIAYVHRLDLAPSVSVRQSQKDADVMNDESKRTRESLSATFVSGYRAECLDAFDVDAFLSEFPQGSRLVFFCVERQPQSCHRSLVSARIAELTGLADIDITPGSDA